MHAPPRRPADVLLAAVIVAGVAWWTWLRADTGLMLEDALITYRYARNLALGNGFVFNPGEHVLATTTPLLALLLGAAGALTGPAAIPAIAAWLMPACGVAAAVLIARVVEDAGFSRATAAVALALYFSAGVVAATAIGGMETPLVVLWMVLSLHLVMKGRHRLAAVVCALLILTRIDGALWAALLFMATWRSTRRVPARPAVIAAALLAPWAAFAWWYFGSVLPHSMIAKLAINGPAEAALSAAGLESFARWYREAFGAVRVGGWFWAAWALFVGVGAVRVWRSRRDDPWPVRTIVAYPLAYGACLYLGRAPDVDWYLVPAMWCSLLLAAVGLTGVAAAVVRGASAPLRVMRVALVAAVVVCFAVLQNDGVAGYLRETQQNEEQTRAALGRWLRENTAPASVVAMEAIGYQGWFSERRVVDLAGLASPAVVRARQASASNAEAFDKILGEARPDFVVLRSFEVDENRHFHGGPLFATGAQRGRFANTYRECRRFSAPNADVWGELSYLTVFGRECPQPRAARPGARPDRLLAGASGRE